MGGDWERSETRVEGLNKLTGSPAALFGSVEIAVKAHHSQTMLFGCQVLVGVVKIKAIPLHEAHQIRHIRRLQAQQPYGTFQKDILNKL